jgi:hypothetical protein
MTGLFIPGGVTGLAPRAAEHTYAPLDWLLQHPMARRWWAKRSRSNVGAAEVIDDCVNLEGGFEGVMLSMVLLDKAAVQGANTGIGWRIYINRVPYLQTIWGAESTVINDGSFDVLDAIDGMGNSWGQVNIYLEENSQVEIGIRNNGGTSDPMGWVCRGAYWPTTLRSEYDAYRRAAMRREAGSDV